MADLVLPFIPCKMATPSILAQARNMSTSSGPPSQAQDTGQKEHLDPPAMAAVIQRPASDAPNWNDEVILCAQDNKLTLVRLTLRQSTSVDLSTYYHSEIVGKLWGSKIPASTGRRAFVTLLPPDRILLNDVSFHPTQILYPPDISQVLLDLNIRPGSIVVESGTGSGALSQHLAAGVAPTGHLYTFEFNEERYLRAKQLFQERGLADYVSSFHRNVCRRGFPEIDGGVDAVFLDLPTPWEVLDSVHRILRIRGRIASFSPCIEQVQRCCEGLRALGYEEIRTVVCVTRTWATRAFAPHIPDWGSIDSEEEQESETQEPVAKKQKSQGGRARSSGDGRQQQQETQVLEKQILSVQDPRMFSHTGYLTFATKPLHSTGVEKEDADDEKTRSSSEESQEDTSSIRDL